MRNLELGAHVYKIMLVPTTFLQRLQNQGGLFFSKLLCVCTFAINGWGALPVIKLFLTKKQVF